MIMNNEDHNVIPPGGLYLAINLSIGLLYALALPIGVCLFLNTPLWATILITLLWAVLNTRTVDRYIPVLTDPLVRWIWLQHEKRSRTK